MNATATCDIVQAVSRHIDAVAPLFDAYRQFYRQESDMKLATQFVRARVEHRDSAIFVAFEKDRREESPLGFTLLYPSFDSISAAPIWILNDLYVSETARRRGIATALVNRGRQLANDTGAKHMLLDTEKTNTGSHVLYESMGFKRDDVFCTYVLDL